MNQHFVWILGASSVLACTACHSSASGAGRAKTVDSDSASNPPRKGCPTAANKSPTLSADFDKQLDEQTLRHVSVPVLHATLDAYCGANYCPSTWPDGAQIAQAGCGRWTVRLYPSCHQLRVVVMTKGDATFGWYFDEKTDDLVGHVEGAMGVMEEYGRSASTKDCEEGVVER